MVHAAEHGSEPGSPAPASSPEELNLGHSRKADLLHGEARRGTAPTTPPQGPAGRRRAGQPAAQSGVSRCGAGVPDIVGGRVCGYGGSLAGCARMAEQRRCGTK